MTSILINILHCSPLQFCDGASSGSDATAFTPPSPDTSQIVDVAGGSLSQSVFHWRELQVLTATAAGSLVVWDVMEDLAANLSQLKYRVKSIQLQKNPITTLTVTDR